ASSCEVVEPNSQVLARRFVARELAGFLPLDEPVRHEIAPLAPDAARAGDPLDRVQVAQASGRFLEIRLERVGRVLVLGVALLLLELLRLEERDGIGALLQGMEQVAVEVAAADEV